MKLAVIRFLPSVLIAFGFLFSLLCYLFVVIRSRESREHFDDDSREKYLKRKHTAFTFTLWFIMLLGEISRTFSHNLSNLVILTPHTPNNLSSLTCPLKKVLLYPFWNPLLRLPPFSFPVRVPLFTPARSYASVSFNRSSSERLIRRGRGCRVRQEQVVDTGASDKRTPRPSPHSPPPLPAASSPSWVRTLTRLRLMIRRVRVTRRYLVDEGS